MKPHTRHLTLVFLIAVLGVTPLAALAAESVRQEFQDALRAKPDLDRGAEHFQVCSACHGPDGAGVPDGSVARIAGQHYRVLVKQLVDFRHGQRWDYRMEHFADRHHLQSVQAIADVAGYVSRLESQSQPGTGNGELVAHGAEIYSQRCQSCHGSKGEGDPKRGVPEIAGQHYEYLRRQVYDAVDNRRPNFSPAHVRLLARLDHDDITGLADFLSRSPAQSAARNASESRAGPR